MTAKPSRKGPLDLVDPEHPPIRLTYTQIEALAPHARKRDKSVQKLVRELLTAIARDNLVDAILDDDR